MGSGENDGRGAIERSAVSDVEACGAQARGERLEAVAAMGSDVRRVAGSAAVRSEDKW